MCKIEVMRISHTRWYCDKHKLIDSVEYITLPIRTIDEPSNL